MYSGVYAADRESEVNQQIAAQIPKQMKHFVDEQTVAGAVTLVFHNDKNVEFDATGMADIGMALPGLISTRLPAITLSPTLRRCGARM